MKYLENIKLLYRAYRYKNKLDRGGIEYILNHIREGDVVMDIGAHKAGYLYFIVKAVGKKGEVYAFEPQSGLYNYLF